MAELNTGGGGNKDKKVRSKKQNAGVDLTAMVDLAFLLITFFMLTTSMNKPQSMNLAMPDKEKPEDPSEAMKVDENRTMTILIGGDNKIMWYMGMVSNPLEGPTDQTYGKNGIRQVLLEKDKRAIAYSNNDPEKGLIVIIRASEKSTYRNLVDILDEMAISGIKSYALVDITPEDLEILGEK